MLLRSAIILILALGVSGCAKSVWAPDDAVAKAVYVSYEPPSITLVTVINNGNGSGGHSALVINASQKVAFDPAGNFESPQAPERNDVVFGMNPLMLRAYYGFHARKEWHVITQTKIVSAEVAEYAFQLAKDNGAVPSAFCSNSVSTLLHKVPGFESISTSMSPKTTMKHFGQLPDVVTDKIFEYD